jgi:hypothetical protein
MEPTTKQEISLYYATNFKSEEMQPVQFYQMNADGTYIDGTTLESVLSLSIHRLQDLNSRFVCRENSIAITKMEEALMWLNKRTENRVARGVEGQHVA